MKSLPCCFACMLVMRIAVAGEIVAWKVPLQRYAWQYSAPEDQTRLSKPPENSPFFKIGDELWDLTKLPKGEGVRTDPPLEWAVWNATTSTLVTKSDWNGIWQLRNQLAVDRMPRLCAVTLDAFVVPADGSPLTEKSERISTISWVSRAGVKASTATTTGGTLLETEATPDLSKEDSTFMGLQLHAKVQGPESPPLEITTELSLRTGHPMWIARDFDGKQGIDLRLTAHVVLAEGSPFEDAMRLQSGNESKSLMPKRREPARYRLHDNRWISLVPLSLAKLAEWDSPDGTDSAEDPFAEPPPPPAPGRIKYPQADVPKELRPWVIERAFDLRDFLKSSGITLQQDDFAGFDPRNETIFFYSRSESELEKFDSIFTVGCYLAPRVLKLTLDGPGQSFLMARSGQKAVLQRPIGGGRMARAFDVEPALGETGDLIELRMHYENNGASPLMFNTTTILRADLSQNLLSGNDHTPVLRARAEIIDP